MQRHRLHRGNCFSLLVRTTFFYPSVLTNANCLGRAHSEGIPTLVIVPVAYYFLPKGPGDCRFLTESENEIVRLRAVQGRGTEDKGKLNLKHVLLLVMT